MSNHYPIPITDIKNHPQASRDPKRINPPPTNTSPQQTATKIRKLQNQIEQLRTALCESLDENDTLRMRVAQLEALLVQAQDQNERMKERYICEERRLLNYWKMSQKFDMQMERVNQSAEIVFHRSRSM